MNQFLGMKSIVLVMISILYSTKIYNQETSYIGNLEQMSGKIKTYFVYGYKEKAEYEQRIIEDAVDFYEKLLNDTFSFDLFVLDRKTWKQYAQLTFPNPHIITDEKSIIMPVTSYYRIQLPEGDSIYGKDYLYYSDFIVIHELGHYISRKQNARSYISWSGEFFADFTQIAYMHEIIPGFEYKNPAVKLFPFLPLKYKSLENFDKCGAIDELFYHVKFQELSTHLYSKLGFNFMFAYLQIYKQLYKDYKDGKFENITVTRELIYQTSIKNMLSIEPDIFNEWNMSMRQTYHSWVFLFGLVLLIGTIRLSNTSYSIFTNLQLKTKKINRIFGVSIIQILHNLKNIAPRSLKMRLIRISVFRIVNYFLILTLIILLVFLLW